MSETEQFGGSNGSAAATPRRRALVTQRDLEVWRRAFDASMETFEHAKAFPTEERYSLTDQIRRSSRSVATSITEAWRKRRYQAAFVAKLSDAEAEAAETQDWLTYAVRCGYLRPEPARKLFRQYDAVLRTLVGMIVHADRWTFTDAPKPARRS